MKVNKIFDSIKKDKILSLFAIITIILFITAIISKIHIKIFQIIPFIVFGIWTIMFMVLAIHLTIKKAEIKLNKNHYIFFGITCLICFLFYVITILQTKQIYTWDQRCYYMYQIDLLEAFNNNSFLSAIKIIIKTTYENDYGNFLLSFTSFIFNFTNKTEYAFILTYAFVLILPVILVFMLNIINIIQKFKFENEKMILGLSSILLITFPLLHKASSYGQPDIFGLFWMGIIILLTTNYTFKEKDYERWIYIIVCSFLLAITRRWYIFLMIGYYFSYGLVILINAFISKDKETIKNTIKNILIFVIISLTSLCIIMYPIIKRTIQANYGTSYSAWNLGGLSYELTQQTEFIGQIAIAIIGIGIIYGLINKKTRNFTFIQIMTYILTIILFTRIQNMYYHQSLILVPEYLLLIIVAICGICQISKKTIRIILEVMLIIYMIFSMYNAWTEKCLTNKIFSNISLKPIVRDDYEEIGDVVEFINENCEKGKDTVYPNFASGKYCGDTLAFYMMPNKAILNTVIYESAIDSTVGFPTEILTAKYVLIANKVIDGTGTGNNTIIPTINNAFNNDVEIYGKFILAREFKITEDLTFYCYERKEKFDDEEISYWKKAFEKLNEKYPDKYWNKIDKYLETYKK